MGLIKTAKSLGFKKGDFIATSMGFVGIIAGGANTTTPLCEVWGLYHELGSVYAGEIMKITREEFLDSDYYKKEPKAYSKEAREALGQKV